MTGVFECRAKVLIYFYLSLLISGAYECRPHIILIVADDLGWNDVSFHGSPQIPTPNIDRLANQGISLNNYYVCPLCTPSRGSLLTGLYPIHTGLQHNTILANEPWGLPLHITTLPQHLRKLNYTTRMVGKWHLGYYRREYTPIFKGFDSHYGYWTGEADYFDHTEQLSDMWGLDFRDNLTSVKDAFGKYSTTLFTDHAVNIINTHDKRKPLFLYVAYQAVHSANDYAYLQAPLEYVNRFSDIKDNNRRIYAGMVSAMDDGVGTIVSVLQVNGMLANSIIVFTTDNGGAAAGLNHNAASNWPLRGVKHTLWEGGVRGACCIWSPYLSSSTHVSMDLMHITDWTPTLYAAAGGNVSDLGKIDGFNMWDLFIKSTTVNPRQEVLLNIDPIDKNAAIRVGKYKLIQGMQLDGQWDDWYGPSGRDSQTIGSSAVNLNCRSKPENASTSCFPQESPCLFDIETDPCEYYNLADSQPEIVTQLQQRLSHYEESAVQPGNKMADPRSDPKYHNYEWVNWGENQIEI